MSVEQEEKERTRSTKYPSLALPRSCILRNRVLNNLQGTSAKSKSCPESCLQVSGDFLNRTRIQPIQTVAEYILSRSRPLSARRRHVASSPLPSAQAYPKKAKAHRGDYKGRDKRKPPPILLFYGYHERGMGRNSGCSSPLALSSSGLHSLHFFSSSLLPELPLRRHAPRAVLGRGRDPSPHPWWRGSRAPAACFSCRPRGPGS